jgi:hypothetical protein
MHGELETRFLLEQRERTLKVMRGAQTKQTWLLCSERDDVMIFAFTKAELEALIAALEP